MDISACKGTPGVGLHAYDMNENVGLVHYALAFLDESTLCSRYDCDTNNGRLIIHSIASCPTLCSPQLIHLGHPLLELDILAFLIRMPLILQQTESASAGLLDGAGVAANLAFPREVEFFESAAVERNEEMGAAVSVG